MADWLRSIFRGRPAWMNALMVFSAYMAFVYVPWDFLFKPVARDEEAWFGVLLTGWAAKATEPLHAAIYAAGAYGFRHMRRWMWPWAAVYVGQVAVGMLVWSTFYGLGGFTGFLLGLIAMAPFAVLAWMLWHAKPLFGAPPAPMSERYGGWALVTGASSGIGAEFARALAREGLPCALSARREDRLAALARELEERHGVETRQIPVDLADPDGAARLAEAVDDLELGVVVNNAGFGYSGRFDRLDPDRLREMIQVNCVAPVLLTRRLLPALRDRGRGAVLFTGSVSGRQPLPLHAVYSASKGFGLLLGESLAVELAGSGVDVLVVEPGSTETEFQQVAGQLSHPGQSPEEVVGVALEALGRQPSVVSGWFNWLRANIAGRLLPRSLVPYIAREVMARNTPAQLR